MSLAAQTVLQNDAEKLAEFLYTTWGWLSLETERGRMELQTAHELISNLEESILLFKRAFPTERDQKLKELSLRARQGDSEAAINVLKMLSGEEV